MNPDEMRKKSTSEVAQARKLYDTAKAEGRSLNEAENTAFKAHIAEADRLLAAAGDVERFEKLESICRTHGESQGRTGAPLPHEDRSNTRNGKHEYLLLKAIRERYFHRIGEGPGMTGLEAETQTELSKRKTAEGRTVHGLIVPWGLSVDVHASRRFAHKAGIEGRALDTTAGAGTIPTILDMTMIDLLRARMVTRSMGAKVMEGMQGLFAIPRQSASGSFYWVAEGGTPTPAAQATDQVSFSPKTAGGVTDYTRRFVEQTNVDAEQFVRDDLTAIVARGVETAGLNGLGSSNQPLGILPDTAIGTEPIATNGGDPTWQMLVDMEASVSIANADVGTMGYITDAAVRGKCKRTLQVSGSTFASYLWDRQAADTPLNGYPVGVTNLLPNNLTKGTGTNLHSMIFGNWSDLIYAFWSGFDVIVDPYTNSSSGGVRIVTLQDVDVNKRHPQSFQKCVDISVA